MTNVMPFPEANIVEPDDIDFGRYLEETDTSAKVRRANAYFDQVMRLVQPTAAEQSKARLPFAGTDMTFRPGEVTIWAGFNSSGKSMLQGQVMAQLASVGEKVCIASFEMKPAQTLYRMVKQAAQTGLPNAGEVRASLQGWSTHLWLYDQQGSVVPARVLALIRYCATELGVTQIAIDSMMKCVRGEDDYNGQKDFVNALTVAARDHAVHIHLVHHMRKGDESKMPTRMDLRGSVAIADHVDNILLLWRNEAKERARDSGQPQPEDAPDAILICDKHRNGDWQGKCKLWFTKQSMRFAETRPYR